MSHKTTDAQRKASRKYAEKFDQVSVLLPKGAKEKIKSLSGKDSITDFISESVERGLKNMRSQSFSFAKDRMTEALRKADAFGKGDTEDKKKAIAFLEEEYRKVISDIENAVNGERAFEEYIEKVLGKDAVEKFAEKTGAKLFTAQEVKNLQAVLDFGFTNMDKEDDVEWKEISDDKGNPIPYDYDSAIDWLFDASRDDYLYASHVLLTAYTRSDDMEKAVTDLLGEEAYDRLVSQGSYWKERLYQLLRNHTTSEKKRQMYFLQYLTETGIFADEEVILKDTEWNPKEKEPEPFSAVTALLSNGLQKNLVFMAGKKIKAWRSLTRDWSDMVVAWKERKTKNEGDAI